MREVMPKHPEEKAFVRLHALVRRGYHADLGVQNDAGLIQLEHPRGARAGAPRLVLHPDGLIHGVDNTLALNNREGDPDCIYASDEADWQLFNSFVEGIPQPSFWQEFDAMTVCKVKAIITNYLIILIFGGILILFGEWVFKIVTRH